MRSVLRRRRYVEEDESTAKEDWEELLERAHEYYSQCESLIRSGDYYDACEKAWAAAYFAIRALGLRYLGRETPPKGRTWREFVEEALQSAGVKDVKNWAELFTKLRGKLHGECFYGTIYEEPEHLPLIKRTSELLELVERLLKGH